MEQQGVVVGTEAGILMNDILLDELNLDDLQPSNNDLVREEVTATENEIVPTKLANEAEEVITEIESSEERRDRMKAILAALQEFSLAMHPDRVPFTPEETIEMQMEFENSVDDLMDMLNFTDSHKSKSEGQKPAQKVKVLQVENLRIISWDLGMLLYLYMGKRTKAVADLLSKEAYEIVFLQEVNLFVSDYLQCRLSNQYEFLFGRKLDKKSSKGGRQCMLQDFVLTLIRRDVVTCKSSKIVYFKNTGEQRTLLKIDVLIGSTKLCLLNTHLESMLGNSIYRVQQLQKCLNICSALASDQNVIFCGSLNIRDWEIRKKIKMHKTVIDVWQTFGDTKDRFTWNLRINKLLQFPRTSGELFVKPQPRKRFDRMYFRASQAQPGLIQPQSFGLVGTEAVIVEKEYFASDHWALSSQFSVSKECYKKLPKPKTDPSNTTKLSKGADSLPGEDEVESETVIVKDSWDDSD